MKKILTAIVLTCVVFASCQEEQFVTDEKISRADYEATVKATKFKGPKNKITIDFTAISDQRAVVTITGTAGEGTFVFDSNNGIIQTGEIPRNSTYDIKWEYYAVTPVECNYMLYWNYSGISIYGTWPYSFILALDVTLENKAVLTYFKDCGS